MRIPGDARLEDKVISDESVHRERADAWARERVACAGAVR